MHHDSIHKNGLTFPYSYCHSRRKTISITVRPDRTLTVRAPLRTPASTIRAFVESKTAWIEKIWNKLENRAPQPQQSYAEGSFFRFQGHDYPLKIETGAGNFVRIIDDHLVVASHELPAEASIRKHIDAWYLERAMEIVEERAVACHRLMRQEQIPLPPITIRSMRSRWGSYSYRTARICLNLNLIKAPQSCLDYVIIHELCHIKVRHHGPDFWNLVKRYVPDYVTLRRLLKECVAAVDNDGRS